MSQEATPSQQLELTFNVGGDKPSRAILSVSGRVHVHRELDKGEEVHLQVVGPDGEIVADGYGRVVGVAFKDKFDKDGELVETERLHQVKVT